MRTDCELLERAARAAGAEMTDYSDRTPDHWIIQHADGVWRKWNPLTDDGDALRLAVKLRLCLKYHCNAPPELDLPRECAVASNGAGRWFSVEPQGSDENAAMRRAIVITAAEIGARAHPDNKDGGAVYG